MAKKKSSNKSAEMHAREASKRMGLEYGNEFASEGLGANFGEGPNGRGEGPKGPNANKKNNKNNR
ncbi:hypothetical protein [Tepidibacter hydrothermalis]|uniref:Small, acid-soluble spore protein, alpha/beta type n=1 Tax=Tepidibacter hydrothermalis TaxID=3036126 RepID=A0ABY8EI41_9FIRM|nr:hypothetical protein [Tepidibacter hydrothermalis]WFD10468.1 hypothetical protein P4S50_19765 [Tepidibacter hydrothermalis]